MDVTEKYRINPKPQNLTIQVIIDRIDKGFELQEFQGKMTEEKLIKYNDAIIIAPDYQRDYRSTIEDESSLIESIFIGIPIPSIFLANDRYEGVQVMNVIDGQHRLRAFYRFMKNKYRLTKLSILKDFEGYNYEDLLLSTKQELISKELSFIVFKDFPGSEFEIEIFNRYNKGTKPLTPQEIRHAVYNSKFNQFVNSFSKQLYNDGGYLSEAYNITKDRLQKKKPQESIFVLLSILESGIDPTLSKSPYYAESFMKSKSEMEKKDGSKFNILFELVIRRFNEFNEVIKMLEHNYEYPFSKELYGVSSRNYKFQISIAMILAGVCHKIFYEKNTDSIIKMIDISKFVKYIPEKLSGSFLEDPEYSASSTNPRKLIELIDDIDIEKILI